MMPADPFSAFDEQLDAESEAFMALVDEKIRSMPSPEEQTLEELRETMDGGKAAPVVKLDHAVDRTIPGPGGPVPVRVLAPEGADGVAAYVHGGAWMGGSHDKRDVRLWALAQAANVVVVSVGYRLAPEHPYPDGLDDCEAAIRWIVGHADAEFGSARVVLTGESAGANLIVSTLLRLRDRDGATGVAGAELRYGMFDLRMTPSARIGAAARDSQSLAWTLDQYVPEKLREDPDVSPLFAQLHDLPPALFTVGTRDPLLDDTLFMWARWRAAGNQADLQLVQGGIHTFDILPIGFADRAKEAIASWIGERARG